MSINIKVVIITLKEYPERLQNMQPLIKQLESIGLQIEFMYGVNGRQIQIEDTEEPHIKTLSYEGCQLKYNRRVRVNGQQMTAGEFGCAWSHHNVYQRLLADDSADAYLVLEDDANPMCPISYIMDALQNLPPHFDILRTSPSIWYAFNKTHNINPYFYAYEKRYANCATSYVISKSGAQKAIQYIDGQLNIPADDVLSNMNLYMPGVISYASEVPWFNDPRTQRSHIDFISSST
jgi:glycosyl transferase, family 25